MSPESMLSVHLGENRAAKEAERDSAAGTMAEANETSWQFTFVFA